MKPNISWIITVLSLVATGFPLAAEEPVPGEGDIRDAVERALPLLEIASAGTSEQKKCFTCHGQAMPVIAIVESGRRGFTVNADNLKRQVDHTHSHLKRGRKSYLEGKGQGGGVDTAGYALWTLEDGDRGPDEVTDYVTDWLLKKQRDEGFWKTSSNRPPTEASNFTTTYLALRALVRFGNDGQSEKIERAIEGAEKWLAESEAKETEDQVFRLLTFNHVDVPESVKADAIDQLMRAQREDGGWAQKPSMESDAYATGTVLYALDRAGAIQNGDVALTRGIRFLLNTQHDDGSWFVQSRSKPFQKYFESGFPYGDDQFISTSATAWATIALLQSLPDT